MSVKQTEYGFDWNAARVERLADLDGRVVIRISAGKQNVEVYVSKEGRSIRVFHSKRGELK